MKELAQAQSEIVRLTKYVSDLTSEAETHDESQNAMESQKAMLLEQLAELKASNVAQDELIKRMRKLMQKKMDGDQDTHVDPEIVQDTKAVAALEQAEQQLQELTQKHATVLADRDALTVDKLKAEVKAAEMDVEIDRLRTTAATDSAMIEAKDMDIQQLERQVAGLQAQLEVEQADAENLHQQLEKRDQKIMDLKEITQQANQAAYEMEMRMEAMEERLERFKGFQPPPRAPVVKPKQTPRATQSSGAVESLDGLMGNMNSTTSGVGGHRPQPPMTPPTKNGGRKLDAAVADAVHATVAEADHSLHQITRQDCDSLFNRLDRNNDGKLSLKEVKHGVDAINNVGRDHGLSDKIVKSAKRFFKEVDFDASKRVDADEFYDFMVNMTTTGSGPPRAVGHRAKAKKAKANTKVSASN
eukprot:SAG31_NODE_3276_length_4474_cov_11.371429_1_plen_414_part_10